MNEIEHEPFYTFEETPREAYDKMIAHFSKPGAHLGMEDGNPTACSYRTKSGYKCAVGCLIPDDEYCTAFDMGEDVDRKFQSDGTDIEALCKSGMVAVSHDKTLRFLKSAQGIHDKAENLGEFIFDLKTFWESGYEGVT